MSDRRHEIGQLEHDVDLIRGQPGRSDRRAQQPAARRPGHPAAVPPSRRPSGPGRHGPDRDGRGRHRAVHRHPAARTVVARAGRAASGTPCGVPSPTPNIWRNGVPACRARLPPPVAARWPRRSASGSPGAWYRRKRSTPPPRARGRRRLLTAGERCSESRGGRWTCRSPAPCARRAGSAGSSSARTGTSRPSSPCAGIGSATHGSKLRSRARARRAPLQQACVPTLLTLAARAGARTSRVVHSQTLPIMS